MNSQKCIIAIHANNYKNIIIIANLSIAVVYQALEL